MSWLRHPFKLARDGNSIRELAKRKDLFLCPYDILTGSDIALFEDTKSKTAERYFVCALDEMRRSTGRNSDMYRHADTNVIWLPRYYAASHEEAIRLWNDRAQLMARRMLKPFPWRFFLMEYAGMFWTAIVWGIVFFLLAINNEIFHFIDDHSYFALLVYIMICSNAKNIFLKSYGEEIPSDILERWAGQHGAFFEEDFHAQAMAEWEFIRESHENSLPIYLLWKRGKLRSRQPIVNPALPPATAPAEPQEPERTEEDRSHEDYCQEIKSLLAEQLNDIQDYRTKITDKVVRKDIASIVGVLGEIQQVISSNNSTEEILLARPVVTYWNEKVLSLLRSYVRLLNNSSDEADATKRNIEEVLQEVHHVYRKELGRITEKNTFELNASIAVMREEIDQALRNRV